MTTIWAPSAVISVEIAPGLWSVAVWGSMIWLVWPWSAVTTTRVSGGMGLGVGQPDSDGVVEGDSLADLVAGVLGMVLLVDGGALDLEEEPLPPALGLGLEQGDGLGGHVGQAGLGGRPLPFDTALGPLPG